MFSLQILLLVALFTVALVHRYGRFNTGVSNVACLLLIRVGKIFSYFCFCRKFPTLVNRRDLWLILLLGGEVSLNPGPLTLGVLNARSIRNKGPLLADMVASNDLEFLCLTETHIRPFDLDSFYGL